MQTLSQQLNILTPSPLQRIQPQWRNCADYQIYIKRDDLIHPIISGNKWRKLSNVLEVATKNGTEHIGSFGGGYSNHIHALAYCCHTLGIRFTAFIRGNYSGNETPMLNDIACWGAEICYLSKLDYKQRDQSGFVSELARNHSIDYMIPEGGSQADCFAGMQHLLDEIDEPFDVMLSPVASGGTIAGLATSAGHVTNIIGIAVLKGQAYIDDLVADLIGSINVNTPYSIHHEYHGGGYAKANTELKHFCADSTKALGIPFEPVYSGKVLFALKHMIEKGLLPKGTRLLMLHTGGMQSAR